MADQYASIIIDISHEDVDRVFQYRIPPALLPEIRVGVQAVSYTHLTLPTTVTV